MIINTHDFSSKDMIITKISTKINQIYLSKTVNSDLDYAQGTKFIDVTKASLIIFINFLFVFSS